MKSYFLENEQAHLRYHDFPGVGVPLVFIHGLGCAASCDYPQVASDRALAGRRMLLIDLLGSGFSDRPPEFSYCVHDHALTIAAFIRHQGFDGVDIFGHSLGGAIAIEVARLLGDHARHLVLGEPNLTGGGGVFSREIAGMPEADYVSRGHENTIRAAQSGGHGIWAASMRASAAFAVHRAAVSLVAGTSPEWHAQLVALSIPRTVLWGSNSPPDADTAQLTSHGVHLDLVPDAGHSMAWENPTGLAAAIQRAIT